MNYLINGPSNAEIIFVLAHGAGAAMDTPFMDHIAGGVAAQGMRVVRFEFPYMEKRRTSDRRPGPDRPPVLVETWRGVIAELGPPERLVIGGKSMGGRVASMVADEAGVAGLVRLGYPFHPAGKPDRPRISHLARMKTPALILQGTRDTLGRPEETETYQLSAVDEIVGFLSSAVG